MHKLTIAILLTLPFAGCSEDPMPPKRATAPEAGKPSKPVDKAPEKPTPPPTPPPVKEEVKKDEKPAAAPVNKLLLDPSLPEWVVKAPDVFKVKFSTSKGDFVMQVTREWSPRGADRIYGLVKNGYYNDVVFFRVVSGFMAQFGINGVPEVNAAWKNATIQDDPVTQSNKRGMVSFAMRGPNSRTTQIFVNFADKNDRLDGMGFSPFGKIIEGMDVVDSLYNGYGEGAPSGRGPNQMRVQSEGNAYLKADFKELDYVKKAEILP